MLVRNFSTFFHSGHDLRSPRNMKMLLSSPLRFARRRLKNGALSPFTVRRGSLRNPELLLRARRADSLPTSSCEPKQEEMI